MLGELVCISLNFTLDSILPIRLGKYIEIEQSIMSVKAQIKNEIKE